jgi:hypothetical protein
MTAITRNSVVVASRDQVASDLAGETVLLGLRTARYYGLQDVGARIWSLIQEPTKVSSIVATIATEYEVTPEQCEADVLKFLEDLATNGLAEVDGA